MATLSHSEKNKGWTSFWNFTPDLYLRLNNDFFTIKNGNLHLHNDIDNEVKNIIYGEQKESSIKTVINDAMMDDKIFKTITLESDEKFEVVLKTNLTQSTIRTSEFNTRESRQFSFIRGNEQTNNLKGNTAQGIGTIVSFNNSINIVTQAIPELVNIGDELFQLNGNSNQKIGDITAINRNTNTITVNSFSTTPIAGLFIYSKKNSRIEGEETRGYYMEVTLTSDNGTDSELFAVNTNAVKSYV